jgi:hypothetical protein
MTKGQHTGRRPKDDGDVQDKASRRSWVRQPLVWLGTLVTAVVTAVSITVVNNVVGKSVPGGNATSASNSSGGSSAGHATAYGPYIAVRHEAGFSGGCGSWIVTKPPQGVSPPPANADWETWVSQNNAIDASLGGIPNSGRPGSAGASNIDVTIQGRTAIPVILTGIQFVAVERSSKAIQGGVVTRACGGPMEARYIVANLDANPVKIVASHRDPFPPPSGERWLAKPIRFPYSVTDTNGEVFKIIAYGHSYTVWYARLFWSVNGKNGESIINDNGRPFRTAPVLQARDGYNYIGHHWYVCASVAQPMCALH